MFAASKSSRESLQFDRESCVTTGVTMMAAMAIKRGIKKTDFLLSFPLTGGITQEIAINAVAAARSVIIMVKTFRRSLRPSTSWAFFSSQFEEVI